MLDIEEDNDEPMRAIIYAPFPRLKYITFTTYPRMDFISWLECLHCHLLSGLNLLMLRISGLAVCWVFGIDLCFLDDFRRPY